MKPNQVIAGIDFGTTNSAICLIGSDGEARHVRFSHEGEHHAVFRSVLNFWTEEVSRSQRLRHAAGPAAVAAYLDDPLASRLIMSMKTYLAQASFRETRIFGRIFRLEDMVGRFLEELLAAAGIAGERLAVVAGRPVRFAGESADDALGEQRLRAAFARAGFPSIEVALEPEGAGYRFVRTLAQPAVVLVADFGGGTSDFSLLRFAPGRPLERLGHAGVAVAGDVFDRRIIERLVSPLLGRDDDYTIMGKTMPVPVAFYVGLSQWHRLALMRTPRVLREIAEVARTARHPERLAALRAVIEDEAGYELYRAVSATKAALSQAERAPFAFRHRALVIEREVTRAEFESWIAADLGRLGAVVDRLIAAAGIAPPAIDHVFLTGGTALVPAVRQLFAERFGAARIAGGDEFIAVAEGLALMGMDGRARR